MAEAAVVRAFLSYAHEDHAWRDRVLDHLGWLRHSGRLVVFDDRETKPGEEWDPRIKAELEAADIVVLLVTPSFMGSRYCTVEELVRAVERRRAGEAELVAIVCDHVDLGALPLARHQCLPHDEANDLLPLCEWKNPNKPLAVIAAKVRGILEELEKRPARAQGAGDGAPLAADGDGSWQLPAPPVRCLGRETDTERLVQLVLAEPPRPICVLGGGGMGKTTLTLEAACHPDVVGRYGARRCFVALEKVAEADGLIAAVGEALGLRGSGAPWPPIETALRGAPAVLVLDNLETPWAGGERATEEALTRLAQIPGTRLLASLRAGHAPLRPRWQTLEVERLMPPHDAALVRDIAPDIPADDPLLPQVLAALDGLPLAIELFAGEAAGTGSLAPAWARWQAERTAMLHRGADADRLSSLDVSIQASLASPRMSEPALRLYALLGRLPDGLALADADALVPGSGADAASRLLKARLARQEAGRLRMLAPVREHAALRSLSEEDRERLVQHFGGLADALPYGEEQPADPARAATARAELANLEAIVEMPGSPGAGRAGRRWLRIASAREVLGNLALAARASARAEAIFRSAAAAEPDNPTLQRDLSVSHEQGRRRAGGPGRPAGGADELPRLARDQGAAGPGGPRQRRLAARPLGLAREDRRRAGGPGRPAGGADELQGLARDRERLARADPGNAGWQRDLSVSHEKIGDVQVAQGDLPAALTSFRASLAIRDRLARADPGNAGWQRDLWVSWWKLADVAEQQGDKAAAVDHFRTALGVMKGLDEAGRLLPTDRGYLQQVEQRLAALARLAGPA